MQTLIEKTKKIILKIFGIAFYIMYSAIVSTTLEAFQYGIGSTIFLLLLSLFFVIHLLFFIFYTKYKYTMLTSIIIGLFYAMLTVVTFIAIKKYYIFIVYFYYILITLFAYVVIKKHKRKENL